MNKAVHTVNPSHPATNDWKSTRGFSGVEVMIAIFLIALALTAVVALMSRSLATLSSTRERIVANFLLQEGIEVVRAIRDENFIAGRSWLSQLGGGALTTGCVVYNATALITGAQCDNPLLKDPGGFFQYTNGGNTIYNRIATVEPATVAGIPAGDVALLTVKVRWPSPLWPPNPTACAGRPGPNPGPPCQKEIIAQELLYNWNPR